MIDWNKIQRRNPLNGNLRWYPQVVVRSNLNLNDIVLGIVDKCTLTKPDVTACVAALQEVIVEQLKNGNSVTFGELGTFAPTVVVAKELDPKTNKWIKKSRFAPNDVIDPETGEVDTLGVHTDCIDGIKVRFTKGTALTKGLTRSQLRFRMIPGEKKYPTHG